MQWAGCPPPASGTSVMGHRSSCGRCQAPSTASGVEAERTLQESHQIPPPQPILSKPPPLNPIKPLLFLLKEEPRGPLQLGMLYEPPPSEEPPRTRGAEPGPGLRSPPAAPGAPAQPPDPRPGPLHRHPSAEGFAPPPLPTFSSGSRSPHSRCRSSLIPTRSSAPHPAAAARPPEPGKGEDREPPAYHSRGMAAGGGAKRPRPRPRVPGCERPPLRWLGAGAQLVVEEGKRP